MKLKTWRGIEALASERGDWRGENAWRAAAGGNGQEEKMQEVEEI